MARDPDAKLDTPTFFKHDIERIAKESVAPIVADLVDKAIDDGRINIDDNVQRIIQADKDILSQIVYDNELHTTSFPNGILPLRVYTSNEFTIIFDYKDMKVYDIMDKAQIGTIEYANEGKSVVLNGFSSVIEDITYILFDGEEAETLLDTWYLYKPVTSAGTKLYKHSVNCGAYDFYIINKSSSLINTQEKTRDAIGSNDTLHVNFSGPNDGGINPVCNGSNGFAYLSDDTLNIVTDTLPNGIFTDTVTEL